MKPRIFAIGDIHGCFDSFRDLVEDEIKLVKSDTLVLLGDYIDRGQKSKEVVDYILNLKDKSFDIIPITGNHEAMLLESYDNSKYFARWLYNGAEETLKSFGIGNIKKIDEKYISFFRNLKYYHTQGNFLFVHAGFNEQINDPFVDKHHMIWVCRERYFNPLFSAKTIVHGHCPIPFAYLEQIMQTDAQVIDVDTGCIYKGSPGYGKLTAIELNTRKLYSVQN